MVLTTRNISAVTIPPQTYNQQPQVVLEHVAGQKLIGLLKQIGQLSDFAADIFSNLLKDATVTSSRVGSLASRVSKVESIVPTVQGIFARSKPSHFYGGVKGGQELNRMDPGHVALFVPESIPLSVARVRALAQPPPQLAILDAFAGKSCLAQYSDPSFFFGQWLKTEQEKSAKLIEENQAKKAARKKKKKKAGPGAQKIVAAVQVKTYSAQGKEFDEQQRAQRAAANPGATMVTSPEGEEYEEEQERSGPSSSAGPHMQAPKYEYGNQNQQTNYIHQLAPGQQQGQSFQQQAPPPQQQQQQQQQGPPGGAPPVPAYQPAAYQPPPPAVGYAAPPPLAPYVAPTTGGGGYGPPPPIAPAYNAPAAPPMAPAYNAPAAPPMAPAFDAPMAPAFDAPPAPMMDSNTGGGGGGGGGGRGGLLDAIRGGAQLKKAGPAAPAAPVGGRSGLLGEIKNRSVALKKVEDRKAEEVAKPAMPVSGAAASIAAVLARRSAISGDDSESEDDEWDE